MKDLKYSFLLAVLISMVGVKGFAHHIAVPNDDGKTIYYNLINNNTELQVTYMGNSYNDNSDRYTGVINIPEEVTFSGMTKKVTSINHSTFYKCSNLTSVSIPNSVTEIGTYAFSECKNLSSLTLGNSVISIGSSAFYKCSNLTSVTIPNSVTEIGTYAFSECKNLSSLILGNSVINIGSSAFYKCNNLTSVIIPNSVTEIGDHAFRACESLTSVNIGNGVTYIGEFAFSEMANIQKVIVHDIAAWCRILFENEYANPLICGMYHARLYCDENTEIEELVIPDGVTSIGNYAFCNCTGITSVTIPNSVTSIGDYAFSSCFDLGSVTIPNSVTTIGKSSFYNCAGLTSITIGKNVASIGEKAFYYLNDYILRRVKINSLVESPMDINENVFVNRYYNKLYVPQGTKNKYKACTGWNKFSIISEGEYNLTYMVDDNVYKSYIVDEGSLITPEPVPTKEGYTFSGWSEIPETMPAHDVTVTGTFTVNSYKLIYKVDGIVYKTYDVEYGKTIVPESSPTKEGYTFSGWSEIPETMPAHDVTVTGTFTVNSYKLTYKVDGVVYKSYDVEYGKTIVPESSPTKEGHTFSGWSEIPETMPAHDVTVTGTFTINSYKLTYVVDENVYKSYDVEYGATITPETAPTKEGYTFSGWSSIPETMPAHNVTINGSFSVNKYKLIYIVDGSAFKTIDVEYGTTIIPEASPTKEGYTFSGWSEIPETMPAHDVTVTGTFTINKYKLTYILDGIEYKSYDVVYGETITPEVVQDREGYTFSGWNNLPETMPAHDVMVTGLFSVNKYKVNYFVDNTPYYTDMVEFGAKIIPPTIQEREGYDFAWSYIPETMPAYDINIYGTYTIKTSIQSIITKDDNKVVIYTIDGKRINKLQRGINIIRMKNGTTRRVVVK